MKKFLLTLLKFICFFLLWAICCGVFEIDFENPVLWRLSAELIPLIIIVILSLIFWLIEKRKITIIKIKKPLKNILLGIALGIIWLAAPMGILYALGFVSFISMNKVNYLVVWILSCFINVVMQELLVRGYLYQLVKSKYNFIIALVTTTILFTLCHGGAIDVGIIPVLNVITMSIFMTLALEYSESFIFPVMLHFIWNSIGAIILGGVSLADDYPSLMEFAYNGNMLLTGGACKIEGSIIVLFVNIAFIILFIFLLKKKKIK